MIELNKINTEKMLRACHRIKGQDFNTKRFVFTPIEWSNKKWCAGAISKALILIPENEYNKLPEPEEKQPDFAAIIPSYNTNMPIAINALIEGIDDIAFVPMEELVECDICDGKKRFLHGTKYYNCKECDETGAVSTGIQENVKDPKTGIKIKGHIFDPNHIDFLVSIIKFSKTEKLRIVYTDGNKEFTKVLFELDDSILILLVQEDAEKYEKFVTV